MGEFKGTPGPWYVGNGDIYADGGPVNDHDDLVICAIGKAGGFRSHEYAIVKAHKPEGQANARAIAALPDLLAALANLLDALKANDVILEIDIAEAAIAKALGA